MEIKELKFNSILDVVTCLDNDLMQRNFANHLVSVCNEVYEISDKKVSGVLLEKSKKKYYNVDVDVVIKAINLTIENLIEDENSRARFKLLFDGTNKSKLRNLRFVLDFFSYIELCGNTDKRYIYATTLCENITANKFFAISSIGFSKDKLTELIMNKEILNMLFSIATLGNSNVEILAYGAKINSVIEQREISRFKIIEVKELISKLKNI
ncbi:hypothetical protein KO488_08105 [Poseidonibacter lekithochrous]|uniref:hypothetical protein n=1 Tax=Poseidonibacter TaxID=2321187 RepID=UPI001C091BD1|nr:MULTISPECIES: hypothetical protein [Poseidonibacter]MBU3014716.1 hypothetical protein [Poseidonibacter lekithochrous]MDO6828014.1 hypothetical protein [Poseidonibacter sp. 1_MG-2023]